MNTAKTKAMITKGCIPVIKQSTLVYIYQLTGQGASYCKCEADITQCLLYPVLIQAHSYHNHLWFQHPDAYTAASNLPCTPQGDPEEDDPSTEAQGMYLCDMATGNDAKADCPVPNCGAQSLAWQSGMHCHFML